MPFLPLQSFKTPPSVHLHIKLNLRFSFAPFIRDFSEIVRYLQPFLPSWRAKSALLFDDETGIFIRQVITFLSHSNDVAPLNLLLIVGKDSRSDAPVSGFQNKMTYCTCASCSVHLKWQGFTLVWRLASVCTILLVLSLEATGDINTTEYILYLNALFCGHLKRQ